MNQQLARLLWMALAILSVFLTTCSTLRATDGMPDEATGKLGYELLQALNAWESKISQPEDDGAPRADIVITLENSATEADLDAIRSSAASLVLQGAYGRLVQASIELPQVRGIAALEQVRSIVLQRDPHPNQ